MLFGTFGKLKQRQLERLQERSDDLKAKAVIQREEMITRQDIRKSKDTIRAARRERFAPVVGAFKKARKLGKKAKTRRTNRLKKGAHSYKEPEFMRNPFVK